MSWFQRLFSFDGRIGRAEYWLDLLIIGVASGVLVLVPLGALKADPSNGAATFALILIRGASWWPYTATMVKLGHDRGYGAVFPIIILAFQTVASLLITSSTIGAAAIIFLIVSGIYVVIDYGIFAGSDARNKYGPGRAEIPDNPPLVL